MKPSSHSRNDASSVGRGRVSACRRGRSPRLPSGRRHVSECSWAPSGQGSQTCFESVDGGLSELTHAGQGLSTRLVVNWSRKRDLSAVKGGVCKMTFVIDDVITNSLTVATLKSTLKATLKMTTRR